MADQTTTRRRRRNGTKPEAKATDPHYTVARVTEFAEDGVTPKLLEVIAISEQAKTQEKAMDAVMDRQPEEERSGPLIAFLASSVRAKNFTAQRQLVLSSEAITIPGMPAPVRRARKAE